MGLISEKTENHKNKIIFQKEFMIVGTKYECKKNVKKKRADVIKKTTLKTPVHIEKYFYNGIPAYMIVNTKLKLDLGVLSANAADWLTEYYSKGTTSVTLSKVHNDTFLVTVTVSQTASMPEKNQQVTQNTAVQKNVKVESKKIKDYPIGTQRLFQYFFLITGIILFVLSLLLLLVSPANVIFTIIGIVLILYSRSIKKRLDSLKDNE